MTNNVMVPYKFEQATHNIIM